MSDETLTKRVTEQHLFDVTSIMNEYPDGWYTARVENDGFIILRERKLIAIAGPGHYQHWFANEFTIPPGIQPALTQSQPAPQQAPADVTPELVEKRGLFKTVMGGKS